jgi:hypothetical protein
MSAFTTGPLRPEQIRSVFPLIREALPDLRLPDWLRFARQMTGRRSDQAGIVVAQRVGRNYPCGLFCYRVDRDLERGTVLNAEHFVAVDLLEPGAVLAALVQELEALGKRLGCGAVRSVVHGGQPDVQGGLAAAGHAMEGQTLLKPLLPGSKPHTGSKLHKGNTNANRCGSSCPTR